VYGFKKHDSPPLSGTATIDNSLFGTEVYYPYGFSFSQAKKIPKLPGQEPDITIDNDGTILNLILQTNNFLDSFYKAGEYSDAASAIKAFKEITAPVVPQWAVWANPVKPNQIWLFRTQSDHFVKLRIISTVSESREPRDYAECTFEWVYQPDGTLTFPGK
jgi:hypothetical protein